MDKVMDFYYIFIEQSMLNHIMYAHIIRLLLHWSLTLWGFTSTIPGVILMCVSFGLIIPVTGKRPLDARLVQFFSLSWNSREHLSLIKICIDLGHLYE